MLSLDSPKMPLDFPFFSPDGLCFSLISPRLSLDIPFDFDVRWIFGRAFFSLDVP